MTTASLEEGTSCSSPSPVSGLAKTATSPALPATRSGRIASLVSCGPPHTVAQAAGRHPWSRPAAAQDGRRRGPTRAASSRPWRVSIPQDRGQRRNVRRGRCGSSARVCATTGRPSDVRQGVRSPQPTDGRVREGGSRGRTLVYRATAAKSDVPVSVAASDNGRRRAMLPRKTWP